MPPPVVSVYSKHNTLPTISCIFHTIIPLSNTCFFPQHFLAPVLVCVKQLNSIFYLDLDDAAADTCV